MTSQPTARPPTPCWRASRSRSARAAARLHRRGARRRQDLRDAAGGPRAHAPEGSTWSSASSRPTAGRTPRRRSRTWRWCRDAPGRVPRRHARGDGRRCASSAGSPQVCVVDELAHTNAPGSRHGKRYQDVLDAARRRHPRDDGGQHPAPRDAERRRRPRHRRARARDRARHLPRPRRRGDQRRRHGRGTAQPAARRQDLPAREGRAGARATSSARAISRRCASWRCAPSPTKSARRRPSYRAREGLEPALIPERVMVCMSSNAAGAACHSHRRPHRRPAGLEAGTRSTSRRPREKPDRIRRTGRRGAAAEHPARREPGRDGRAGDGRQGRPTA